MEVDSLLLMKGGLLGGVFLLEKESWGGRSEYFTCGCQIEHLCK